jgi:hypothetical protein
MIFPLSLLLSMRTAWCLAPPLLHDEWERVDEMRARLEIDYNYEPQYVDSEHCRFLTEAECEDYDQDYGRQLRERRLNPSEGDFKVLVLLIKFSDHADKEVPPREYYEELFNGSGPSDINEVGSMKDWLNTNSMGKYKVQFDVRDWEVAPNTESFYAAGNAGRSSDLQEIYRDVLTKIDNEGSVTFTDGYIDTDGFCKCDFWKGCFTSSYIF